MTRIVAKFFLFALLLPAFSYAQLSGNMQVFDTPGTYRWAVPQGVTQVTVEVWGAGGGGGGASFGYKCIPGGETSCDFREPVVVPGGGGAGGGYGKATFTVRAGASYTVAVGTGGAGGNPYRGSAAPVAAGGNGSESGFGALITAAGGEGGQGVSGGAEDPKPGKGGSGGTSSAAFNIAGKSGSGFVGGDGANGGAGAANAGENGIAPGGGGAGGVGSIIAGGTGGLQAGGSGASGRVVVQWSAATQAATTTTYAGTANGTIEAENETITFLNTGNKCNTYPAQPAITLGPKTQSGRITLECPANYTMVKEQSRGFCEGKCRNWGWKYLDNGVEAWEERNNRGNPFAVVVCSQNCVEHGGVCSSVTELPISQCTYKVTVKELATDDEGAVILKNNFGSSVIAEDAACPFVCSDFRATGKTTQCRETERFETDITSLLSYNETNFINLTVVDRGDYSRAISAVFEIHNKKINAETQFCVAGSVFNLCSQSDTSCGKRNCVNCNSKDGWYDTEKRVFICANNTLTTLKEQEFRDYGCGGFECDFTINGRQFVTASTGGSCNVNAQVSIFPSVVKQNATVLVESTVVSQGNVALTCALPDGSPLCKSGLAKSNPFCFFESPWSDTGNKTFECAILEDAARISNIVTIVYSPSANFTELQQSLKDFQLFSIVSDTVNENINLPTDIVIDFTECGEANAFYDPVSREIKICYELIDRFHQIFSPHAKSEEELWEAVFDATEWVIWHETGHALIDVLDLPITGREEDSADQLATWVLTWFGDIGERIAINGANWFALEAAQASLDDLSFWDTHSLDQQRFYNVLCWIYGNNPQNYSYLIDEGFLPASRASTCESEYIKMANSWTRLLTPYLKEPGAGIQEINATQITVFTLTLTSDNNHPTVFVHGAPETFVENAVAGVSCLDNIACDTDSFRLLVSSEPLFSCPRNYSQYEFSSPKNISKHSFLCAAALDIAGNEGFSEPAEFLVLGKDLPVTNIIFPPTASVRGADFPVSIADDGIGADKIILCEYRVISNGAASEWLTRDCNAQVTITVPQMCGIGTCKVEARAIDILGREGFEGKAEYIIDTAKPEVKILSPAEGSWQANNFAVSIRDDFKYALQCDYRVLSNEAETVPFTLRECNSDITITVGANAQCRDSGANKCRIEARAVGETGVVGTASRSFSIDFSGNRYDFAAFNTADFEQTDTGVKFSGSILTTITFPAFIACGKSTIEECKNSFSVTSQDCGLNKPCLCGSLSSFACEVKCNDFNASYYLMVKGFSAFEEKVAVSIAKDFACPSFRLGEINNITEDFKELAKRGEIIRQQLTYLIEHAEDKNKTLGYANTRLRIELGLQLIKEHLQFINDAVKSLSVSKANEIIERSKDVKKKVLDLLFAPITSLAITDKKMPSEAILESNSSLALTVENKGENSFAKAECEFADNKTTAKSSSACLFVSANTTRSFSVPIDTAKERIANVSCFLFASPNSDCSSAVIADSALGSIKVRNPVLSLSAVTAPSETAAGEQAIVQADVKNSDTKEHTAYVNCTFVDAKGDRFAATTNSQTIQPQDTQAFFVKLETRTAGSWKVESCSVYNSAGAPFVEAQKSVESSFAIAEKKEIAECSLNLHCPGTDNRCFCSAGSCAACSAGTKCVNHQCLRVECSDSDCPAGKICQNNRCVETKIELEPLPVKPQPAVSPIIILIIIIAAVPAALYIYFKKVVGKFPWQRRSLL